MEIPRHWREQSTSIRFEGWFKKIEDKATGRVDVYFKYPGGEIPVLGVDNFMERLMKKGFDDEVVVEIVELYLDTVSPKAAIPIGEFGDSFFQQIGGKVREEDRSKV